MARQSRAAIDGYPMDELGAPVSTAFPPWAEQLYLFDMSSHAGPRLHRCTYSRSLYSSDLITRLMAAVTLSGAW